MPVSRTECRIKRASHLPGPAQQLDPFGGDRPRSVNRLRCGFVSFAASSWSRSSRHGPSFGRGCTRRLYSNAVAPKRTTLRTVFRDTSTAHLDHDDDRAILVEGDEGLARIKSLRHEELHR